MQPSHLKVKDTLLTGILFLFSASILLNSESANAETTSIENINIPTVMGARVFAKFDDKVPAVINYFTVKTEAAVIEFYQGHYGAPTNQERKRGRLTLNYLTEQQQVRIVISQQNKQRQVDVIISHLAN